MFLWYNSNVKKKRLNAKTIRTFVILQKVGRTDLVGQVVHVLESGVVVGENPFEWSNGCEDDVFACEGYDKYFSDSSNMTFGDANIYISNERVVNVEDDNDVINLVDVSILMSDGTWSPMVYVLNDGKSTIGELYEKVKAVVETIDGKKAKV